MAKNTFSKAWAKAEPKKANHLRPKPTTKNPKKGGSK